ncbi:MAG: hypothetical protein NVS1B4_16320 [Gemmatimonadaceae bacterium]
MGLMLDAGRVVLSAAPLPALPLPPWAGCAGTRRAARATAREIHGVWWVARGDGGGMARPPAGLYASRSEDGGLHWSSPVAVDTTDAGTLGCDRPPAAIAADSSTGYVHVAYYAESLGGGGVFFAHSMDRGHLFHDPVAVVYGPRPSFTSVAAVGDTVAVAYEDPNVREGSAIVLALSRTAGHIFEDRVAVSGSLPGQHPHVALAPGGGRVAVAWQRRDDGASTVRVGKLRSGSRS